jgi:hypothetical protein
VEDVATSRGGRLVVVHGKLTDVTSDRYREMPGRIHVPEQHIRYCIAGLLAQVPTLQNCRDL